MPEGHVPRQIGQFEVLKRLGAGGMAEVFLAKKRGAEGTFKLLVVKRILQAHGQSRRFRQMFVAEAQLATRLNHPNIVQVYDFQDIGDEGQLLSMEYVEGVDLGKLVSAARGRGQRIPAWVCAYIVAEAGKGLHYAHERKDEAGLPLAIVHRDVSPQNILISYDGSVKIADFGIASANLFREEPGVLKGKFAYMSPEQARGEVLDRRSDIFALGVCLHEMLTGRPLYGSLSGDDLLAQVRDSRPLPPGMTREDLPKELDDIVMKALERDREQRFQTARDMSAAISRAILARQELLDASSVEAVVSQLAGREHTSPGFDAEGIPSRSSADQPVSDGSATIAAAPRARQGTGVGAAREKTGQQRRLSIRASREVRHVALVTLRVWGLDDLEQALGKGRAAAALEPIRRILDEIAYKRGAHWAWADRLVRAQAVVGLLANSSRAAADAAWIAVDVHEALAGAAADLPVPIHASVGIVRGVASGERDKDGRLAKYELQVPVELLANLLRDSAPVGTTWVAGGLYRMVRRDFRWGDAPPIDVPQQEGLSLPRVMRVYALERPLSREERFAEMALAPSDLMGRDAEKADLHAAYHRAMAPEGPGAGGASVLSGAAGAVVARAVVGEVGIGKTALVEAFMAELPPEARALRVEVIPARAELPFSVVGDLLREALGVDSRTTQDEVALQLRALLEPYSSGPQSSSNEVMLRRLVEIATGKQGEIGDEDEVGGRDKLVGSGVRRVLASLALRQPLVLLIDGLQWGDTPSLELMHGLLRRADPIPILVILVSRPDERVLPYLDGVVRIDLRGLSRDDQVRLVEARLGVTEGVAAVCDELVPRVAGNPFFLLEMIDALLERGALELQAGSQGSGHGQALVRVERPGEGRGALPSTLEQIISDRLRELPPEERMVVDWLAVARGPLGIDALGELTRDQHREAVMRLCARGVCDQRGESIDLRHTIARDVAYTAIDVHERKRMHQQIGTYLAASPLARGLSAALVAWHLARGVDPASAADHYLEAAQAARSRYQMKHAMRYFRHVLRLVPKIDARRLIVHEALETLYRVMGRHRERRKNLTELRFLAREIGTPRWVAVAFVRSARFEFDEGQIVRGLANVERGALVAQHARATAIEVEAYQLKSDLLRETGDMAGALLASDRAIELASEHPEATAARARAEALRSRGIALRYLGRVSEAVEAYAEAIAVFRHSGARRQEARAKNSLAFAMFVQERWEDTIALALDSIQIDRAIGGRFQIAKTLSNVGQSYARLGDTARAIAYLKRAREAHERFGDQDGRADTLLCTAEVLIEAGDVDGAHVFCGDASALNSVSNNGYDVSHEKLVRAMLAREAGDHASCANMAAASRAMAAQHKLVSFGLYASAVEAAALAELGEAPSACALALSALHGLLNSATEYSLEIRAIACHALDLASSSESLPQRQLAREHAEQVAAKIRDDRLRRMFRRRPIIVEILGAAPNDSPSMSAPVSRASGSIPVSEPAPQALPAGSPLLVSGLVSSAPAASSSGASASSSPPGGAVSPSSSGSSGSSGSSASVSPLSPVSSGPDRA